MEKRSRFKVGNRIYQFVTFEKPTGSPTHDTLLRKCRLTDDGTDLYEILNNYGAIDVIDSFEKDYYPKYMDFEQCFNKYFTFYNKLDERINELESLEGMNFAENGHEIFYKGAQLKVIYINNENITTRLEIACNQCSEPSVFETHLNEAVQLHKDSAIYTFECQQEECNQIFEIHPEFKRLELPISELEPITATPETILEVDSIPELSTFDIQRLYLPDELLLDALSYNWKRINEIAYRITIIVFELRRLRELSENGRISNDQYREYLLSILHHLKMRLDTLHERGFIDYQEREGYSEYKITKKKQKPR